MKAVESSLPQFFVPQALDSLHRSLDKADEVLDQVAPNLPRWLGETANVAGGGAKGLSDRFVSGFLWVWICLLTSSRCTCLIFLNTPLFPRGDSPIKRTEVPVGNFEKNTQKVPSFYFVGVALYFYPKEVPILKQHITSCQFFWAQYPEMYHKSSWCGLFKAELSKRFPLFNAF